MISKKHGETSRTQNSVKNATINLIIRLTTMVCSFIMRTVFLKYLGDRYTGISTLFTDILNILSFTELGIGTAVSFSLYKPIAEKNNYRIAQLMKLYKYVYLAVSMVILVIGLSFIPFLDFFVNGELGIKESKELIYIMYLLKTAFSYLLVYKATFVIAEQKQYVVTGIEGIGTILKTVLEIIILVTTKNFIAYLILEILAVVMINIAISVYAKRDLQGIADKVKIDKTDIFSLFKDVKDIVIYKASGIVLNSTDSLIISRFINITSVTLMSNYNMIFNTVNSIMYQIISAMTASIGNLSVLNSKHEQKRVFLTVSFLTFMFSEIECTGMWLCIDPFIETLWGKRYILNSFIKILLCINSFIINMHLSVDMFRTANGIFHKGRLRPLATAIVNLVVSLIAVKYMGLAGVLFGTVVSRAATQLWYDPKLIYNIVFDSSVKRYYLKYFVYFATIFANCFIGKIIIKFFMQKTIIEFVLGVLYTAVSSGLIVLLCYRKTDEYKNVIKYVKALIRK